MAKDPAFLFYPNDWIGGTMGMTFEEKGAYMELLMMQFNRGHMTSHMIGQAIGQLWVNIQDKFTQDENGLWYNQRLEEEKNKRQKFTESRRNNISGSNQHTKKSNKKRGHKVGHMTSHMEDVNENEDESIIVVYPFDSENFKKWWSIWKEYKKKEHRFNYKTKISEQAALKKLSHLSGGNESKAAAIIEQSISEGWKGFFELKQSRESTQKSYENLKRKFREEAENQK
jgi:uncharacterized protein YdaU (DUF1376 family)